MPANKRLVIVPTDPISAYERKGIAARLPAVYNPSGYFDEVFVLDPFECHPRELHGLQVIPVSPLNYQRTVAALQPVLVRAYGGQWAAELACYFRAPDIPVIVSLHDTHADYLRPAVALADHVIAVSDEVRRRALKAGISADRISVIPNAIDASQYVSRKETTNSPFSAVGCRYSLLCVGRLSEEKNQISLVAAMAQLPDEYHLFFVGPDNGLQAQLKQRAQALAVDARCHFLGPIDASELPRYYSHASALLNPSLWEGFGMVFIEAMASGLPVITSDLAPMNNMFTHEKNAYLVHAPQESDALAESVQAVCEDEALRARLCENGLRLAQQYNHPQIDAQSIVCYEKVIQAGARKHAAVSLFKRIQWWLRFTNAVPLRAAKRRLKGILVGAKK